MRKLCFLPILMLSVCACSDSASTSSDTTDKSTETSPTYAEISVKEGGTWNGRKYEGGEGFVNVEELQVPANHTDHSYFIRYEGPGWENSQIGYRLYLDWRNAIDIFGKRVDSLILPYVGQDGFDSYHEAADWGQDILKAGKSMGIGGYGRLINDTIAHFQQVAHTVATVENADTHSTVQITYEGWQTEGTSIDLLSSLTIFPQDRFTKVTLTPSAAISGLCTGIVQVSEIPLITNEKSNWAYMATFGAQTLVSDSDSLGMALFYKLSEVENQIPGPNDHLVVFTPSTETITYYLMAAWDQEPDGITTKKAFLDDLDNKLAQLENRGELE